MKVYKEKKKKKPFHILITFYCVEANLTLSAFGHTLLHDTLNRVRSKFSRAEVATAEIFMIYLYS